MLNRISGSFLCSMVLGLYSKSQTHSYSYCRIPDLAPRYCVDSLLLLLQSIIATPAGYEFKPSYPHALTIAVYVGMLLGALFWGMSADVIGRRFAFNVSLFLCSAFTIIAGAAPNWTSLAVFIALLGFGVGIGGETPSSSRLFREFAQDNVLLLLQHSALSNH
jgi:MFS family permease